eukprot:scaffold298903_cov32-Tisochrysis_lutea.AAC.1
MTLDDLVRADLPPYYCSCAVLVNARRCHCHEQANQLQLALHAPSLHLPFVCCRAIWPLCITFGGYQYLWRRP